MGPHSRGRPPNRLCRLPSGFALFLDDILTGRGLQLRKEDRRRAPFSEVLTPEKVGRLQLAIVDELLQLSIGYWPVLLTVASDVPRWGLCGHDTQSGGLGPLYGIPAEASPRHAKVCTNSAGWMTEVGGHPGRRTCSFCWPGTCRQHHRRRADLVQLVDGARCGRRSGRASAPSAPVLSSGTEREDGRGRCRTCDVLPIAALQGLAAEGR